MMFSSRNRKQILFITDYFTPCSMGWDNCVSINIVQNLDLQCICPSIEIAHSFDMFDMVSYQSNLFGLFMTPPSIQQFTAVNKTIDLNLKKKLTSKVSSFGKVWI